MSLTFKNEQGSYLTKALFYETNTTRPEQIIYTLKDEDHKVGDVVYPSLRKIYVSLADPTEYSIATRYLGGWAHWKKLLNSGWFVPLIEEWREELEVALRSDALRTILVEAKDEDSKNSYAANKLLLEGGWKEKAKGGVGRTTKEKIKQEADALFKQDSEVIDDYKRMKDIMQ